MSQPTIPLSHTWPLEDPSPHRAANYQKFPSQLALSSLRTTAPPGFCAAEAFVLNGRIADPIKPKTVGRSSGGLAYCGIASNRESFDRQAAV
jgi:hypothetical protein